MKLTRSAVSLAAAIAGVLVAACTASEAFIAPRPMAPIWRDTGTPPASAVAREPEARYYTDSSGAIWDDRGKRVETEQP